MGQTIGARWIVGGIWLRKEAHGRAKNVPKSSPERFVLSLATSIFYVGMVLIVPDVDVGPQ